MPEKQMPKIGISTCLLGHNVRYNAGHKLDHYIRDTLGKFVEFVQVCPEVEAGFGVPREAIQLHEIDGKHRIITQKSKKDLTPIMDSWIENKLLSLKAMDLCGYILKAKSPSCGVYRTRLYRGDKGPSLDSRGLFAQALINNLPELPVEEEGRLQDHGIRENFIQRVFIYYRWKLMLKKKSVSALMDFHQKIKYTLMAQDPQGLKDIGQIVAKAKKETLDSDLANYFDKLNSILKIITTNKKHKNVLDHLMGYFKENLSSDEKQELIGLIDNYYNGLIPIIVPITLINHYVKKYDEKYLATQFYLNPLPMELMLRNHV